MIGKNKKTEQYIESIGLQLPQGAIYALSNSHVRTSFTKSQVERDLFQDRFIELANDYLDAQGFQNYEEKLVEMLEEYESCQEWDEEMNMITGTSVDEIADWIKHYNFSNFKQKENGKEIGF